MKAAVVKKDSIIIIDCGAAGTFIRRITAIKMTPDGVCLDLKSVGRAESERRWAKKKGDA